MKYETISKKILAKDYHSKLPYPQYRPDATERKIKAEEDSNTRDAYRKDGYRLQKIYETDLRKYIEHEIGKQLTDVQYQAIFRKAWDDGHAHGYHEVLLEASNLVDVVKVFL